VQEITAEASKRVRAELTDPDRVTAKVCTALEQIIDEGLDCHNTFTERVDGNGDMRIVPIDPSSAHKNVIAAANTWADIAGIKAPKRIEAKVDGLAGLFAELERIKPA
jgi:hypothetical protein